MNLMMKMLESTLDKMSHVDKMKFIKEMDMNISIPSTQMIISTLQTSIRMSGFAAYQFATKSLAFILQQLGIKASMPVYLFLTQSIKLISGPVAIALNGAWLASDIASPAYRVTIPACIIVGCLRQRYLYLQENKIEK